MVTWRVGVLFSRSGARRYAERLLGDDGVNVIFGCTTSSCRKAVLPVVERRNGLLSYPSLI
jgi:ABC-type branched-subunit amino acid transport system substrate-binding protein